MFNISQSTFTDTVFVSEVVNCSLSQIVLDEYYPGVDCVSPLEFEMMTMSGTDIPNTTLPNNLPDTVNCTLFLPFFPPNVRCISSDSEINMLIAYFAIIAVAAFLSGTTMVATYQLSGERQVYKMRLAYYRAVLRQNIAWFDENSSGAINSRLSE